MRTIPDHYILQLEGAAQTWSGSFSNLGVLLVDSSDFNFLGFYMSYNKEAKSLTFWRGLEVSQGTASRCQCTESRSLRSTLLPLLLWVYEA